MRLAVSELTFAVKSKEAADQCPLERVEPGLRIRALTRFSRLPFQQGYNLLGYGSAIVPDASTRTHMQEVSTEGYGTRHGHLGAFG